MKTSLHLPAVFRSESALRAVQLCAGAIAIGLIFWKLQFATAAICCGDGDGYYHIKWSRMLWDSLRHRSFPPSFTWLPLTTLEPKYYVDHHLAFHFFQIPFTWFGDLRLGAKISAIIFASTAVFACYWLLVRYRIRYGFIWLLALLAGSAPFLYRLNMAKAPPLTIIYLVIGIHLLFTRKYWLLLPLSFVFALTYDMFVLLILAAGIWTAVIGWAERRLEWRPIAWVLLGTMAGFVINPYFPNNLHLLYEHLKIKIAAPDSINAGGEWYPYDSWELFRNSIVACAAMVAGYLAFNPSNRPRAQHSLFFLVFATALMIMTARWKRIAEYWPPFAVIFSAFALEPWLQRTHSTATRRSIVLAAVVVGLGGVLFFNLRETIQGIAENDPAGYYRAGAEWLRANVPPGQMIFNTDWDDFPRLFFFNPGHVYVSGLDPTYLYKKDKNLSELYERVTLGEEEDPGPLIRDRFGAHYVFTDNLHDDFLGRAQASGWFEIVYADHDCTILHIRDQKIEPEANDSE